MRAAGHHGNSTHAQTSRQRNRLEDPGHQWSLLHKAACPGQTVTYVGMFGKSWGATSAARAVYDYFRLDDPEPVAPELGSVASVSAIADMGLCVQIPLQKGYPVPAWSVASSEAPVNEPSVDATGLLEWLPDAADAGKTFTFTVTATNLGGSASTDVQVTVRNEINDAFDGPTLAPGLGFKTPVPGPTLTFTDGWAVLAHNGRGADGVTNFDTWSGVEGMPQIEARLPTCGDFFIETRIKGLVSTPAAPTSFHLGLFVAFDSPGFDGLFFGPYQSFNILKLERAGNSSFPLITLAPPTELGLRLERRGGDYICMYRTDPEAEWIEYPKYSFPGARVSRIGLCSKNWGASPAVSVSFDYLKAGVPRLEPPVLEDLCPAAVNRASVGDLFVKRLNYVSGTPKPTAVFVEPSGAFNKATGIYSVTPQEAGIETITVRAEMEGVEPVVVTFDLEVIEREAMFEDFEVGTAADLPLKTPPRELYDPLAIPPSPFSITGDAGEKKLQLAVKSPAAGGGVYNSWETIDNAVQLRIHAADLPQELAGDFTVETKLTLGEGFSPDEPFHLGLCVGFGPNQLFFWGPYRSTNVWLEYSGQNSVYSALNTAETMTLRIRRECDFYYFLLKSEDGDWRFGTVLEAPFSAPPSFVGLFVKTWGGGATVQAEFDYFDIVNERSIGPELVYVRVGDTNNDGALNIADAVTVLGYLFVAEPEKPVLSCRKAADANDDGKIDIADAITILGYLFAQGNLTLPDGTVVTAATYPGCAGFLPEEVNEPGTGCDEPCVP